MTRETKIGLLVGLAFIIVIGILLSDHFRTTMEPTQAALVDAITNVREGISSPGKSSNPPITIVVPQDAAPKQSIPTKEETNPPVVPLPTKPVVNGVGPVQQQLPKGAFEADDPGKGTQELANIARRNGMEIVPEGTVPTPYSGNLPQTTPPATLKSYTAQAGDSVSRMAAKLMGADNRANRQAIINANSSLQDDPDLVVVGQTYVIPTAAGATAPQLPSASAVVPAQQQPVQQNSQFVYTVKEGDNLWRIANDQLGDSGAVEAIKSLNLSVLKGPNHDILTIGAKLRLPSKPIASATN